MTYRFARLAVLPAFVGAAAHSAVLRPTAPSDWKPGATVRAFAAGDGTRTREFVWGQKLEPVQGTFRVSATDNTWEDTSNSQDALGECVARVRVPRTKNDYYIKFTRLRTVGERRPTLGGVMVNHPMFGNTEIGGPGMFPRLHAYVAVWGAANVVKNGKVIGRDRAALAWVGQAGRDRQGKWLFDADKSRVMAHVVVFGALGGGTSLPDTPDGHLHFAWPAAKVIAPGFVWNTGSPQPTG